MPTDPGPPTDSLDHGLAGPPRGVLAVSFGALLLGAWVVAKGLSASGPPQPLWPVAMGGWLFVSGAGMLEASRWARLSFCAWAATILTAALATGGRPDLGVWLLLGCVWLVNNKGASDYFGGPIWPLRSRTTKPRQLLS